ncbi:hypothetical protein IE00_19095 [Paracoccus sp. SM22M-07]|nr:hypothetical protein IE00_19095 [Paracoccus sp. SM22M-07]
MGAPVNGGIVAFPLFAGAVSGAAADLIAFQVLAKQVCYYRFITDMKPGYLHDPNLQRFLADPKVNYAPGGSFGPAMLASLPIASTPDLDTSAVNRRVQRILGTAIGDFYSQHFLVAAQRIVGDLYTLLANDAWSEGN